MKRKLRLAGALLLAALPLMAYTLTTGNDGFDQGTGAEIAGWTLNPGIIPSGTAEVRDGVLAIATAAGQRVQFYAFASFKVWPGETITLAIRVRGRGRFSLGTYLYTPGPKFHAEQFGEEGEGAADWQLYKTTLAIPDDQPLTVHPVIAVQPDARLEFDDFQGEIAASLPEDWQPVRPGTNDDPAPGPDGALPYEMAGRAEPLPPLVDFTDCARYVVENHGTDARLFRTSEQRLFRDHAGKVTFRALEPGAWFDVRPAEPPAIPDDADCVNIWNYGCSWCWVAEPHLFSAVLLLDGEGREQVVELEPMYYTYWHIQHKKLPGGLVRPLRFAGLRFKGGAFGDISRETKTIYLDSVTFYRQSDKPLLLEDLPAVKPFPTTPDTILPTPGGNSATFADTTGDGRLRLASTAGATCLLDTQKPFLDGLVLQVDGHEFIPFQGAACKDADGNVLPPTLLAAHPNDDRIRLTYRLPDGHLLDLTATLRWKSLVLDFQESSRGGQLEELHLGRLAGLRAPQARQIPMISYGWGLQPPQLVQDGDLFCFGHFDWYRSDGSELFACNAVADGTAEVLGGVRYYPNTAGVRNGVRERFVFTASAAVEEVFPNIPNPPSPMRDRMVGRAWRIKPGVDYEAEVEEARKMRARGLSDVAIRYHESTWRDGGESYTFRTEAAPAKGGNPALRQLVEDIQSLGWLAGVYTGYNDLAPVNQYWDEDALARDRHGNWITGWARCYQPKPVFSWKMAARLAPEIGRIFGNRHVYCDVHTAVAPWIRTDFDHRAPGAASFRKTFEAFGLLLSEQRAAYGGPVYSEGGCHWFYAGLLDGNYGQLFDPQPWAQEWFPDFNLRKIHPLGVDAGMGSPDMFYRGGPRNYEQFIATTLVYGNIAILDGTQDDMERMYYLLTPLQPYYVMEEVQDISWFDKAGTPADTSAAMVSGVQHEGRIRIAYRNGFTLYANANPDTWTVAGHALPQWGWLALSPDGLALSARELLDGHAVEWSRGEKSVYWRSPDGWTENDWFAGRNIIILKREQDGWHAIEGQPGEDFRLAGRLASENGLPDGSPAR